MNELAEIIAKYEKWFEYDVREYEQEIKNLLPIIRESFIEFYGENQRKEIEDKFRRIHIMIPPPNLEVLYKSCLEEIKKCLKRKYPQEYNLNIIFTYGNDKKWYTNNLALIEEIKIIREKLVPLKEKADSYDKTTRTIRRQVIEEKKGYIEETINGILKEECGYKDDILSKLSYDLISKNSITPIVDLAKERKKVLGSNDIYRIIRYIRTLRNVGMDIPKLSIEQYTNYYAAPKEEQETAIKEGKAILASESVTKYLPSEETANKIANIYSKVQYEIKIETAWRTMQRVYGISKLPSGFLGERRYNDAIGDYIGLCSHILYQESENIELWNVIYLAPYFTENIFLGIILIHESNHAMETTYSFTTPKTYVFNAGWEISPEIDVMTHEPILYEQPPSRPYEITNEVINEFITREIWNIIRQKTNSNLLKAPVKGAYYNVFFMLEEFYQTYKVEIIKSRQNNDINILFEKVGRENMEAIVELVNKVASRVYKQGFEYDEVAERANNGLLDDNVRFYLEAIEERDRILSSMQVYSKKINK